jgi:hypothetical protein
MAEHAALLVTLSILRSTARLRLKLRVRVSKVTVPGRTTDISWHRKSAAPSASYALHSISNPPFLEEMPSFQAALRSARTFPFPSPLSAACRKFHANPPARSLSYAARTAAPTMSCMRSLRRPMILSSSAAMKGVLGEQLRGGAMAQGVASAMQQARGMKVRASVKKLCEGCKVC